MGLKDFFRRNKDDDENDEDDDDFGDEDDHDFDDDGDDDSGDDSGDDPGDDSGDADDAGDDDSGGPDVDDTDDTDDDPGFGGLILDEEDASDRKEKEESDTDTDDEDPFDNDSMMVGGGDEEDDEEDEGRKGGLFARPVVLYSAAGLGGLIILGGVVMGVWSFIGPDGDDVADQVPVHNGASIPLPPVEPTGASGGLNAFSDLNALSGADDRPAEEVEEVKEETIDSVQTEQVAVGASISALSDAGGLNALAGGGLNAVAAGSTTVEGLIIPASSVSGYEPYVDHPTPSPLPRAPDADFLKYGGEDGKVPLPRVAVDGRVPWQFYGRPLVPDSGGRRVALLVTGMGLSTAETLAAIQKLPPEVTLSFSPYAENLEQWLLRSRRMGHEVMLGLPLESARFPTEDPGPLALRTGLLPEDNLALIEKVLSLFQGYTGLEVMMGSKFTASETHVRDLLNVLNGHGLMIMDNAWNTRSQIPRIAGELGMPRIISDLRLDSVMALSAIDARFRELDTLILTRSQAVATTGMSPAVMDRLKTWLQTLPAGGVELVPVSTLVDTSLIQPPPPE